MEHGYFCDSGSDLIFAEASAMLFLRVPSPVTEISMVSPDFK
jgi:hypothetical protein